MRTATTATLHAQDAVAVTNKSLALLIVVTSLGYFVDIYDLILFSVVRVESLQAIGVPPSELLGAGVLLLNTQMIGMLVGGILWGVLGDKRGRLSVLFGSIVCYSLANIANGLVTNIPQYVVVRLIAGIGLAGELGVGIALVSESMSTQNRGYGAMIVSAFGILGAVFAALVGDYFTWRTAYFVGGAMGLCLLLLRIGVYESEAFKQIRQSNVRRGDFFGLFRSAARVRQYLCSVLIGMPIWFIVGILVTFSPEFGVALGMQSLPNPGRAVMFAYLGFSLGSILTSSLSQVCRNRKKVTFVFLILCGLLIPLHFVIAAISLPMFYTMCLLLGIAGGYWPVFLTMAAEQFGTNIRATVSTTTPNFVRGAVVPMTMAFQFGRGYIGIIPSALLVGLASVVVAGLALRAVPETFGKDLNFVDD